jgi:hypothetical protein
MSEIATIIAALAALATAAAAFVLAVSRLGPLVNAVNKMLTDQSKRAVDSKNKASTQSPRDSKTNTDEPSTRGAPPELLLAFGGLVGITAIVSPLFLMGSSDPATSPAPAFTTGLLTLALLTLGAVVTTVSVGAAFAIVTLKVLLTIARALVVIAETQARPSNDQYADRPKD